MNLSEITNSIIFEHQTQVKWAGLVKIKNSGSTKEVVEASLLNDALERWRGRFIS